MFAILDKDKRVTGHCSIDVHETGVELPEGVSIFPTDEEATFFEDGKFIRKNIYKVDEHKSRLKSLIHKQCKEEMESKNVGIDSISIGAKIDCREFDVTRVDQVINLHEFKDATDETMVSYILHNNSQKQVKLSQMKGAKHEMVENLMSMLYYKHSLYAQIEQATTKEELDLIAWEFVPMN